MENWRELFDYSLIAMSSDRDLKESKLVSYPDSSENVLSPVTNLLLNTIVKFFDSDQQSLIINFPKKILKPIPLISYIYSEMKSKSVLIFTAGNINNKNDLIRIHNDNYYLLTVRNQWGGSFNVLENCSIGYLKNQTELAFKFFLPYATSEYKKNLNKNLNKILGNPEKPKIVLMGNSSLTSLINTINNISIDNDELDDVNIKNNIDLDIGCIIFENADRYFSSKYSAEFFVKWLKKNVNQNIKILLHFSNHDLQILDKVKESLNAKVLSFNGGIIKNNDILIESSLSYFEKINDLDIVGKYNLDDENDYLNSKIILDDEKLNNGNMDYFTYSAKQLTKYIKDEEIGRNSLYYNAQKLFLDLNNLTINPSFLKFQIKYKDGFSYVTVPQFIDLFNQSLEQESPDNQLYLRKYIILLNQFYQDLCKRKRYFEDDSYNNIGKDYRVFEIIENQEKIFNNDNDLIIGTFLNTEPGILYSKLKDYKNVEVKFLGNLIKEYSNSKEFNLLLPGFVPPRFLAELYKDYSKIFILNYDGFNRKNIIKQIESIEKPPISDETKVMNYFLELYDYLGMSKENAFVKNYNKRLDIENKNSEKIIDEEINLEKEHNHDSDVDYNYDNSEENYEDYLTIIKNIEKRLNTNQTTAYISPTTTNSIQNFDMKKVVLDLKAPGNNDIISKAVPARKKYLHFKDYGSLKDAIEIRSEDLSKGDYIIFLDNENISFIDLFIEIFKLDENIDKNLADYWKDKLSIFVEENNLSYEEMHELYREVGGQLGLQTIKNWIKGYNISPGDYEKELYYLSQVMDDDFLLNNISIMGDEFRKIKSLHIALGINLKSIMRSILVEDFSLNYDSLSLEEQTMYNIIKNSVYEVLNVKNV